MTATICVTSGCGGIPSARSRKGYCSTCAKNARAAWSAMIADKTKGNLTLEEQRLMENSLTELRFRFVQANGKP